jgi:hypothetical protein
MPRPDDFPVPELVDVDGLDAHLPPLRRNSEEGFALRAGESRAHDHLVAVAQDVLHLYVQVGECPCQLREQLLKAIQIQSTTGSELVSMRVNACHSLPGTRTVTAASRGASQAR